MIIFGIRSIRISGFLICFFGDLQKDIGVEEEILMSLATNIALFVIDTLKS